MITAAAATLCWACRHCFWLSGRRATPLLAQMLKFSAAMAMGNLFVFRLQLDYESLTVTKTTTVRKLISVFVSVRTQGARPPAPRAGSFCLDGTRPQVLLSRRLIENQLASFSLQTSHVGEDFKAGNRRGNRLISY